ncbi:heptaprenyl diphosphate synthase [Paenibacillus swuensis]|uniref:Heptaprenyl diphosphate synthase n=1 Tax=Paenibacillus swuensis TaxID=1178515 RepID=A0A172TLQ7_9BACL|nr:heptaprenyl diphosphate synthase component II [Paenibacillus swuensis]ANE47971.1 heptaprenyl diphosphate synthase [Paenibacillus swuensis]
MKLIDIYARLRSDIQYIEKELERSIDTEHAVLNEASLHLLKAGGKRIRPVFVLLAGELGRYDLERLQRVAVPLELIHMASLVHDDVIDNANTRRGQLTVKSKWDNRVAMYTGDYIYAKALTIVTQLDNPQIHRILSKAMLDMCIGEMEQIRDFFNTSQTVRNYLLRIRRKTALLIAVSCQLGAIASEASEESARIMYKFGYNAGMAFQIRDDILDLLGTEKQLGKPPGSDMRQGNITLPVLLALENPDLAPALLEEIRHIREAEGQADTYKVIQLIRRSDGVERADKLATQFINKAIAALDALPESKTKKNFVDIAHFIGKRLH